MEEKRPEWELFFLNELDDESLENWEAIKNDPLKSQIFRDIESFFTQMDVERYQENLDISKDEKDSLKNRFKALDTTGNQIQLQKHQKKQNNSFYYVAAAVIIFLLLLWYLLPDSKSSQPNPRQIVEDSAKENVPENNYTEKPQIDLDSNTNNHNNQNITENNTEENPSQDEPQQDQIPENQTQRQFNRNQNLDALIAMNTRTNEEFKVVTPLEKDTLTTQITFNWENNTRKEITFILVDDQNTVIEQGNIQKNQNSFDLDSSTLQAGIYYWKILSAKNQLLHIGSFYWIPQ